MISHELHTHAYRYGLTWGQQYSDQISTLELLSCTSQLFRAGDYAWIATPVLSNGIETEPFLIALRQGQFAAKLMEDFVLSIATHMEAYWQQRYPDAAFVYNWHPPIDSLDIPELTNVSKQDDVWVLEIATSFDTALAMSTVFSVVWLHYLGQDVEIRIVHTTRFPFVTGGSL